MNYFVFGYSDKKCSQGHECLYAGTSRSEAIVALKKGAEGIEATQLFASPMPSQTVRHGERARRLAARSPQAEPETPEDSEPSPQGEESTSPQDAEPAAETPVPAPEVVTEAEPVNSSLPLPLPEKPGKKK